MWEKKHGFYQDFRTLCSLGKVEGMALLKNTVCSEGAVCLDVEESDVRSELSSGRCDAGDAGNQIIVQWIGNTHQCTWICMWAQFHWIMRGRGCYTVGLWLFRARFVLCNQNWFNTFSCKVRGISSRTEDWGSSLGYVIPQFGGLNYWGLLRKS